MVKGLTMDGAAKGLQFLFKPDWSSVTTGTVIMALGQAFFGLSLGQGTMVTYGSYLSKKENIPMTCLPIALSVIVVSLLAGIAIFSVVFSVGMEPDSGPSLMFKTLPLVLSQIAGGYILSIMFFLLVFLAGLTSQISAMEPVIAYLMDEKEFKRHQAVALTGVGAFLLGIPSALAFGVLSKKTIFGDNFFDFISFVSIDLLVPLGGLAAVLLVGWKWGLKEAISNMEEGSSGIFKRMPFLEKYLGFIIRYFAPLVIVCILFNLIFS